MNRSHTKSAAGAMAVGAALVLAAAPALAAETTVTDPANDTSPGRGGPDILSTTTDYGNKRITVKVKYRTDEHVEYARDMGTITGANLKFKNGKEYTLERHAEDPGWQTPLENTLRTSSSRDVKCDGIKSSVSAAKRQVTVSAPVSCFKGKGTKLKAQSFSFTVMYDLDETNWSKWIKQG